MNIVLWILQVLLALAFSLTAGSFFAPAGDRRTDERVAAAVVPALPRRRGSAGRGGTYASGMTRILPWLVGWAAAGIMIVTVSATVFHLMRGEMSSAAITLVLFVLATFVAYMRHRVLPIGVQRV